MKLMFVYWGYENAGSMLDLRGYARAARAMGHEVTVYGPPNPKFALDYSQYLDGADAVVFVFEWTTALQFGDRLDWARLVEAVPRNRRLVIDCDGAYNDPIEFRGDYNHRTVRIEPLLDGRLRQPVGQDLPADATGRERKNVRPFLFHIYDPTWETPLEFADKEFGMIYVGHTKFRWRGMSQGAARHRAGAGPGGPRRAGRGGLGASRPDWMEWDDIKANYYVDRDYLKRIGVEALPAVPVSNRSPTRINKGVFNPVVYRPLFERLGMVTCRTFETPAAGTIPLFLLDRDYVAEIFRGARARAGARRRRMPREDRRRAGAARALRRHRDGHPRGLRPAP